MGSCLAHHLALPRSRTKLLSLPVVMVPPREEAAAANADMCILQCAGIGWPGLACAPPPPLTVRQNPHNHQHYEPDCLNRAPSLPPCSQPPQSRLPATPTAHPCLLSEGQGPFLEKGPILLNNIFPLPV